MRESRQPWSVSLRVGLGSSFSNQFFAPGAYRPYDFYECRYTSDAP